ncbi:MAG: polyamine aminopropyltransferase [Candidatus Cloacimonetes bacterium]|nr:polyamine aminopropyltransferase [Candidatus Cloacimonadota bacterium]
MDLWFTEKHTKSSGLTLKVTQTLLSAKSPYQELMIIDTPDYGRVMLLDGLVMLTERDEFVYHEMLAHPSLYSHPNPEKVLIIGGGDGGTLREVVKHSAVKRAVLVEIDKMVMAASKEFFPHVASGFNSSKAEVIITDGIAYVNETEEKFDLILIDSTDPIGPAEGLFHIDFYRACHKVLNDDGILTTQSETPFIKHFAEVIPTVMKDFKYLFPLSKLYLANIPTYPSGLWSFSMGSKKYDPEENFQQERYNSDALSLSYYNDRIHQGAFCLPNFVKKLIEE